MKKILLFFGIVIISIVLFLFVFGKIKWEKPLTDSNFNKEYYNTNDLILINVWATWCSSCIEEFPNLEKFQDNKKVKFISLSIDRDSLKLKKFLEKNVLIKNKDITLKNSNSLDVILNIIGFSELSKRFRGAYFEPRIIPYIVLIKNKKVLYSAVDNLDSNELQKIIDKN